MIPSDDQRAASAAMTRGLRIRMNGTPATWIFNRGDRDPAYRGEPTVASRSSRRCDGTAWAMWAYHAALGDLCQLRTPVAGVWRVYTLPATPAAGRAYLEALALGPWTVMRHTAMEWLRMLNRTEEKMAGNSLSEPAR